MLRPDRNPGILRMLRSLEWRGQAIGTLLVIGGIASMSMFFVNLREPHKKLKWTPTERAVYEWAQNVVTQSPSHDNSENATSMLTTALEHGEVRTRLFVLWVLENVGDPEWTLLAERGLDDRNSYVRLRAAKALTRVTQRPQERCLQAVREARVEDAGSVYASLGVVEHAKVLEMEKAYTAYMLDQGSYMKRIHFLGAAETLLSFRMTASQPDADSLELTWLDFNSPTAVRVFDLLAYSELEESVRLLAEARVKGTDTATILLEYILIGAAVNALPRQEAEALIKYPLSKEQADLLHVYTVEYKRTGRPTWQFEDSLYVRSLW